MNTEQAYAEGFVKRAMEYGFSQHQALELYKQSAEYGSGNILEKARNKTPSSPYGISSPFEDYSKFLQNKQPNRSTQIGISLPSNSQNSAPGGERILPRKPGSSDFRNPTPGIGNTPSIPTNPATKPYLYTPETNQNPALAGASQQKCPTCGK